MSDIDLDAIDADRDQLWAEAIAAFQAGEPWWLEGAAEEMAHEEQALRLEADPWGELVAEQLAIATLSSREFVTISEVLTAIGVPGSSQHSGHARRINRIMTDLGWKAGRNGDLRGFDRPKEEV